MVNEVVILDNHSEDDGRLQRHIRPLMDSGVQVYRLNFNYSHPEWKDGRFSSCGESGYRFNYLRFNHHLINIFFFLLWLVFPGTRREAISTLRELGFTGGQVILHVHDAFMLPLATGLGKRLSSDIVYDRHEAAEAGMELLGRRVPRVERLLEFLASRRVAGVVLVSDAYKEVVTNTFPEAEIVTVPNFVQTSEYDDRIILSKIRGDLDQVRMIYVGSLNWKFDRDIGLMLRIAEEALQRDPHCRFLLGGMNADLELMERVEQMRGRFGERFVFTGPLSRKEVVSLTQISHIGFLLTRPESLYWIPVSANKVYEYIYCGVVPVVRANIEGHKGLKDAVMLYSREDPEERIVRDVLRLIEDRGALKERMKEVLRSRESLEPFDFGGRYRELYDRIGGPRTT